MSGQETNRAKSLPIRRTHLDRQTPFSFSCTRCLKCCESKRIQVNPYEIARLAGNLGISTTEFIAGYTEGNGSFLKFDDNNACSFLGPEGCRVHADRPLVCRLYPLGRHLNELDEEWFSEIEPDPDCRGQYGSHAALENYLDEQETEAYIQATNRYLDLLWKMMNILEESSDDDEGTEEAGSPSHEEDNPLENGDWLDMDRAVAKYCRQTDQPFPLDLEKKTRLHLEALQRWIKQS